MDTSEMLKKGDVIVIELMYMSADVPIEHLKVLRDVDIRQYGGSGNLNLQKLVDDSLVEIIEPHVIDTGEELMGYDWSSSKNNQSSTMKALAVLRAKSNQ